MPLGNVAHCSLCFTSAELVSTWAGLTSIQMSMSALRRLTLQSVRNWRLRAEHSSEKFWSEGKNDPGGYLFCETPPPPGQKRKWEDWEAPWYFTLIATPIILIVGLNAKPDTNLTTWAHQQALKELEAEGEI